MVMLIFRDGGRAELADCVDVVHVPGFIVCFDALGAPLASFLDDGVLGYTLDPDVIQGFESVPEGEPSRRSASRKDENRSGRQRRYLRRLPPR